MSHLTSPAASSSLEQNVNPGSGKQNSGDRDLHSSTAASSKALMFLPKKVPFSLVAISIESGNIGDSNTVQALSTPANFRMETESNVYTDP